MKKNTSKQYRFDKFRVDSKSCSLYFENELIRDTNKKSLQVLIVLLDKPRTVVTHEEIIERVWGENYHGVTSNNVAQYVLKLRKTFAKFHPQKSFIGTDTKRGYIFEADVFADNEADDGAENKEVGYAALQNSGAGEFIESSPAPIQLPEAAPPDITPNKKNYRLKLIAPPLLASLLLLTAIVAVVRYFSLSDEEQVRQIVKESQMYESLFLYANPSAYNENDLKKYWLDEPNESDLDVVKVRNGVKNLLSKNAFYGKESKCEKFDFVSIEINETKDFAIAKTIEKWFVAKYRTDGTLLENKIIGPYSIIYNLRKINGYWLIEKSSTARAGG